MKMNIPVIVLIIMTTHGTSNIIILEKKPKQWHAVVTYMARFNY